MALYIKTHIVKKGETTEDIISRYNIPDAEILRRFHDKNAPKGSRPIGLVLYAEQEIGFLYGMTKSGRYILIGGNQDNTIRFDDYGEYTSNSKLKKLYGFYIPIDYSPKPVDELKESDIL